MVGEQRCDVAAVAQDIVDEALQRLLWSDFHKEADAGRVQRLQSLDELHGRSHLLRQDIEHLRYDARPHRVKLAADVGDDG